MVFTREDILKILNALLQLGRKDSEFKDANTPLNSNDEIVILQDGINKKVSISNLLSTLGLLKKDDFINVSDRYNKYYIQLFEAITIIAKNKRKKGLVITFLDLQGNWKIYLFNGEINNFINTEYWKDLLILNIIDSILPDEEDLTLTLLDTNNNSFIKFKDKDYNPNTFSGKGYKILRKNIINDKNVLTQDMVNKENTIYEIRYDFDLNSKEITIPEGCILDFHGGSINNGVIFGCNTAINDANYKIFSSNLIIQGTWNCEARAEWFDGDIQKTLDYFTVVHLYANKRYLVKDTLIMPARGKIVGKGNSSIIETNSDFTVIKMGYYCTLSNLAIKLNVLADVIEVSSSNIAKTMKNIGELSPGNCNILIENVTINSIYNYIENNATAIKLLSNGAGELKGFWGIKVVNTNIFGGFRYGITVDCIKDNDTPQNIEPWITDCHFLKINSSLVMDFIKVGNNSTENLIYNPLRIEFTQCSMLSRDAVGSVFEHQKFAIVERGTEINFIDCMPWDFELSTNKMFRIYYGSKVTLTGAFTNSIDSIVELAGVYDGKLPYSCSSTLYPSNDVREFYFNPPIPEDGHVASYKEVFGNLPDGDYYTSRVPAFFRYIGIDTQKCKPETSSSFLPLLSKKKVLNGNTYLITLRTNFGVYGSASCVYCKDNENDEIEWRYDAKDIPVFSTREDISSDYIRNNNNSFVIINGLIAYISNNRLTDLKGSEFIPAFYNKTIAELPQLNNHKFNDGKCVFVNGLVKPVYYSYRDKIWVDAMGADASLYYIGSVAPTSKRVFGGFKFYSNKYKKILICVSSKRTVESDGSITYVNKWVDANGYTPSVSVGTTTEIPKLSSTDIGFQFFNTIINKPIWWNGSNWINALGNNPDLLSKGTTEQRPTLTTDDEGYLYFDTTLHKPIWWNGTLWIDGTNTPV